VRDAGAQRAAAEEPHDRRHAGARPDHQGLETLYKECAPRLASRLYMTGLDRAEAEDIVQDTFIEAARQWELVSKLESPYGWLHRVATRRAIDRYRSGPSRREVPTSQIPDLPAHGTAATEAITNIALSRVWEVINKMPVRRSHIAMLRWRLGYTIPEIAAHLGISQATVRVHLHDARKDLLDAEILPGTSTH
jgi:RNA polymerase sigma factor (sigma-70 family)